MTSRVLKCVTLSLAVTLQVAPCDLVLGGDDVQTLLISGQQAPGLDPGTRFDTFHNLSIRPLDGSYTFNSYLLDPNGQPTSSLSLWTTTPEELSFVARVGDPAPGRPPGTQFTARVTGITSGSGEFGVLKANTRIGTATPWDAGVWTRSSLGELELAVHEGDLLPDANGDYRFTAALLRGVAANGLGHAGMVMTIIGNTPGTSGGNSIYRSNDDGLALVAKTRELAPLGPPGAQFLEFSTPSLSDHGRIVFASKLSDAAGTYAGPEAIWGQRDGEQLELIALGGSPAPGTNPGALYENLRFGEYAGPGQSGTGHLVFRGTLTGAGVDVTNNVGIWIQRLGADTELLVRKGDQAGSGVPGERFAWFGSEMINDYGQTVFEAGLMEGMDDKYISSMWKGSNRFDLQLIVREGDVAPGTGPEDAFRFFHAHKTNRHGQAAFKGFLEGPMVSAENELGIWAEDVVGELHLIARMGDAINVSDDPVVSDERIVQSLGLGGIDDQGRVFFTAGFADGTSGIFSSSAVAVPAPPTSGWLVALTAVILRRRRKRFIWRRRSKQGLMFS